MKWSAINTQYVRDNFTTLATQVMADHLGRTYISVASKANLMGLLKPADFQKEKWTEVEIQFLKDNFSSMTAIALANALNKKRTIVRMKYKELGLAKMELEYWSDEQVAYLKAKYKTTGDVEIAEKFQQCWPKNKKWTKNHINKKRRQLNLHRTPGQIQKIVSKHVKPGGRSYTIKNNSSSLNLHEKWVAQQLAWRNPEMQKELLKQPQLIRIGRVQILLNRTIKQQKHAISHS